MPRQHKERKVVGWREWIALPEFGLTTVKAKIDTGARTSSLHAYDVEEFRQGRKAMVRFKLHPEQRNTKLTVRAVAPLIEHRRVTPSSGHTELRPVIATTIELLGEIWSVELTLTRRDEMGFRMLLGRQALRRRFVVDPAASFLNGKRAKGKKSLANRTGNRRA